MPQFTAILQEQDSSLGWYYFIDVPEQIALDLIKENDRRVSCSFNRLSPTPHALMPNHGAWYININKEIRQRLKVVAGDKIHVDISRDDSKYGMPVPEELMEVIYQDAMFEKYFHALSIGKQRSLIYIVAKIKNSEGRIRKSLAIAEHLIENLGKIDYKGLNEKIKEFNRWR